VKVVLVNPNYHFWKTGSEFLARALGRQAPLGLLSLASYVKAHLPWVRITLIDAGLLMLSAQETVRRILAAKPDLVGITVTTVLFNEAKAIARRIKAESPATRVIVGGPHVSGSPAQSLNECEAFDLAVVGEGEETFKEILEACRHGLPLAGLPGVVAPEAGNAGPERRPRKLMDDLDRLPPLAWDLLPGFPGAYGANIFFSPGGTMASLTTSRGCPFSCRFCDQSTFGRRFRAMSAARVVQDVRAMHEQYGVRYLVFCDDTFTLDRSRVLEICQGLQGLRVPISWSCDANVMTIDPAMLRAMKAAGCWSISYGIESGSETILRSLDKRIELDRAREVIAATRKAGIHAKGLFILGTPEESRETIKLTQDFIRSVPFSTINLSKFTPYPGLPLTAAVQGEAAIDFSKLNGMNFVCPSRHLTLGELEEAYEGTLRGFFNTRSAWRTHLGLILGRWENARRFFGILPRLIGYTMRSKIQTGNGD
jgi:anaerobic magnesium-protoporphyrin IX monomethyl ester cyclase